MGTFLFRNNQICDECKGCGVSCTDALYERECLKCRKSGLKNVVYNNKQIPDHCYIKLCCKGCNGIGKKEYYLLGRSTCDACHGIGDVMAFYMKIRCGYCNNTGRYFMDRYNGWDWVPRAICCAVCNGY